MSCLCDCNLKSSCQENVRHEIKLFKNLKNSSHEYYGGNFHRRERKVGVKYAPITPLSLPSLGNGIIAVRPSIRRAQSACKLLKRALSWAGLELGQVFPRPRPGRPLYLHGHSTSTRDAEMGKVEEIILSLTVRVVLALNPYKGLSEVSTVVSLHANV